MEVTPHLPTHSAPSAPGMSRCQRRLQPRAPQVPSPLPTQPQSGRLSAYVQMDVFPISTPEARSASPLPLLPARGQLGQSGKNPALVPLEKSRKCQNRSLGCHAAVLLPPVTLLPVGPGGTEPTPTRVRASMGHQDASGKS